MHILIHPTYFPSIAHFVTMVNADDITMEIWDNYQKQTYRNRTCIYAANGLLTLSIPVVYSQKNRQLYRDIKIANTSNWQALHWKSLLSAYSTSPFFEYYKDDIAVLFETEYDTLMDFNMACLTVICDCLQLDNNFSNSQSFEKSPKQLHDYRFLVNARQEQGFKFESYTQVFSTKHGFLSNLSILDLLFNEGPNSLLYLEKQNIKC